MEKKSTRSKNVIPISDREPIIVEGEKVPVILSLIEVAELLNLTKNNLSTKLDRQMKGMNVRNPVPIPFTIISSGPLWTLKQVEIHISKGSD